jgi:hypothetical protein
MDVKNVCYHHVLSPGDYNIPAYSWVSKILSDVGWRVEVVEGLNFENV